MGQLPVQSEQQSYIHLRDYSSPEDGISYGSSYSSGPPQKSAPRPHDSASSYAAHMPAYEGPKLMHMQPSPFALAPAHLGPGMQHGANEQHDTGAWRSEADRNRPSECRPRQYITSHDGRSASDPLQGGTPCASNIMLAPQQQRAASLQRRMDSNPGPWNAPMSVGQHVSDARNPESMPRMGLTVYPRPYHQEHKVHQATLLYPAGKDKGEHASGPDQLGTCIAPPTPSQGHEGMLRTSPSILSSGMEIDPAAMHVPRPGGHVGHEQKYECNGHERYRIANSR